MRLLTLSLWEYTIHTNMDPRTDVGRQQLGKRIQAAIADAGYESLCSFGTALGVSQGLVYRYASGATLPPLDRLQAIAELCGKSLTWFLVDDPQQDPTDAFALRSEVRALKSERDSLAAQLAAERERRTQEQDRRGQAMQEAAREICVAYRKLGDTGALLEAAPRLLELARERGDARGIMEARLQMGHAWFERSDLPRARASLERALEAARELRDARAEQSALQELVRVLQASGNLPAAREYARALADSDAWWSRWAGEVSLAALDEQAGDLQSADQHLDRAEDTARSGDQPHGYLLTAATYIASNRVNVALSRGAYRAAESVVCDMRNVAAQASLPDQVREAALDEAIICLRTGRLAEAREKLDALREWAELAGDPRLQALAQVFRSELHCRLGDFESARACARAGLELAAGAGRGHVLAEAELSLGLAYLEAGRLDDAGYHLARAGSRAAKLQWRRMELITQVHLARCRMADDSTLARQELLALVSQCREADCLDLVVDCVALIAPFNGDPEGMEQAREVTETARRLGHVWGERRALLAQAAIALEAGDPALSRSAFLDALSILRRAREGFDADGATEEDRALAEKTAKAFDLAGRGDEAEEMRKTVGLQGPADPDGSAGGEDS